MQIANLISCLIFRGGRSFAPAAWATGLVPDDRTDALENVTRTIGNLLDGYDIRLRPNFGGKFSKMNDRNVTHFTLFTNYIIKVYLIGIVI